MYNGLSQVYCYQTIRIQRVNKGLYFILNIAPPSPFKKIHFEVKFSLDDSLLLEGTTIPIVALKALFQLRHLIYMQVFML